MAPRGHVSPSHATAETAVNGTPVRATPVQRPSLVQSDALTSLLDQLADAIVERLASRMPTQTAPVAELGDAIAAPELARMLGVARQSALDIVREEEQARMERRRSRITGCDPVLVVMRPTKRSIRIQRSSALRYVELVSSGGTR